MASGVIPEHWPRLAFCLNARGLSDDEKVGNVKVAGATPMWEWAGDETTVFSY